MNLNPKQKQFCEEYLIDLNATQAAIRAGYSEKTANRIGSQNLTKVDIQSYITELMQIRADRTEITQDRVLKELAMIAFLDIRTAFDSNGNLLNIQDMPENVARAIGGLDITQIKSRSNKDESDIEYLKRVKIIDKKGCLELIGKHLAMWADVQLNPGDNISPYELLKKKVQEDE